jgi:hypothetical protein
VPNFTPRLALPYPIGSDLVSTFPTVDAQQAAILDNAMLYTEGNFASRPAVGAVEHGHIYRSTDTGIWYQSDGTNWLTVMLAGLWLTIATPSGFTAVAGAYVPAARVGLTGPKARGSGSRRLRSSMP